MFPFFTRSVATRTCWFWPLLLGSASAAWAGGRAATPASPASIASAPAQHPHYSAEELIARWTGLRFAVLESKIRRNIISTRTPWGLKIRAVVPGSAAERAGLLPRDVLMSWNGEPVRDITDIYTWLTQAYPGASFDLEVSRLRKDAPFASRTPWQSVTVILTLPAPDVEAITGIRFAVLESMVARNLVSTRTPYGLRIDAVRQDSPAAAAGLKPGDVVLQVDGEPLLTTVQLRWILLEANPGATLHLDVRRCDSASGWLARDPWSHLEVGLPLPLAGAPSEGPPNR